jgi:monoamine oxidase
LSLANLWDGRLKLASTEMASQHGGYLEGACEAAAAVFEAFEELEEV